MADSALPRFKPMDLSGRRKGIVMKATWENSALMDLLLEMTQDSPEFIEDAWLLLLKLHALAARGKELAHVVMSAIDDEVERDISLERRLGVREGRQENG